MAVFDSLGIRHFAPHEVKTAPVVMVHGFAATGLQVWERTGWVKRLLGQGSPVLLVDLPFHGEDWLVEDAPEGFRSPTYDDVLEVTGEHLLGAAAGTLVRYIENLGSRVHLVGFSAGARIAYEAAARASSSLLSLTLGGLPQKDDLVELRSFLLDGRNPELDPALEKIVNDSVITREGLKHFAVEARDFAFDPDSLYPQCPTLLVTGEKDTVAPDSVWLQDSLEAHGTEWRAVTLEKRDHVNALTSGVFKRETLRLIQKSYQPHKTPTPAPEENTCP